MAGLCAITVLPKWDANPIAEFAAFVLLRHFQTHRAAEFAGGAQGDRKNVVLPFLAFGLSSTDELLGHAIGIGMRNEQGSIGNLGRAGEALHGRSVGESEGA